jgi:hypothetical protein
VLECAANIRRRRDFEAKPHPRDEADLLLDLHRARVGDGKHEFFPFHAQREGGDFSNADAT